MMTNNICRCGNKSWVPCSLCCTQLNSWIAAEMGISIHMYADDTQLYPLTAVKHQALSSVATTDSYLEWELYDMQVTISNLISSVCVNRQAVWYRSISTECTIEQHPYG